MTFFSVEILVELENSKFASTLSKALEPDNKKVPPHVKVKVENIENILKIESNVEGRLESLQATLDDLVICFQAAYQSLFKILEDRQR